MPNHYPSTLLYKPAGAHGLAREWRKQAVRLLLDESLGRVNSRVLTHRARSWPELVRRPQSDAELAALRHSLIRGAPFGEPHWTAATARRLGLESTLRPRGRPRKSK